MQKRMRQLDGPCGDPMFACFAQMRFVTLALVMMIQYTDRRLFTRICHLLETWIKDYPDDFAVKGTAGALNALIKSIISKTHLLHYGSEFLPFLEMLPSRSDQDASWALKAEVPADESDDSYSFVEEDEEDTEPPTPQANHETADPTPSSPESQKNVRERKSSIPLAKGMMASYQYSSSDLSPKQHLKDLVRLANDVLNTESEDIAQEITRQWLKRFMAIKPRDWLQFVFVSGGKLGSSDPISEFNGVSNHLGDWYGSTCVRLSTVQKTDCFHFCRVVSLILCHDRPRHRARQVEKFVDIAHRLRVLNNYSALRAVISGIFAATFAGDETMELFKTKSPEQSKNLASFDVLLQSLRAHRAYRLALRNSKGACIPAMYDLHPYP